MPEEKKYVINAINKMPNRLTQRPMLYISFTFIKPLPYTIVFGAVATGNIKPSDAAKVAGTIKLNAGRFNETDKANKIGRAN